jgi:membrane protease YdiL (CAAX protease family)
MNTAELNDSMPETASRLRLRLAAHPVATYLVLALSLSWAVWIPQALGAQTVQPGVGWPSHMPGLLGPALSAVIVTWLIGGKAGLTGLWQRITAWRIGRWWWAVVAILLAGAIGLVISGGVADSGNLTLYNGVSASLGPLATILLVFLVNGIGEEAGWRGFMADRLLRRHGITVTALLVALGWALWHVPMFFVLGTFKAFTPGTLVAWLIGMTAGSILLTWLYDGSGRSILLVAVWHTAFNYTSATPATTGLVAAITSTMVMVAAVVIVIADWMAHRRVPAPGRAT